MVRNERRGEQMKYLPIGSIVILNKGVKKLMIYGRRQMAQATGIIYDYVGCLYPEGNISPQYTYLFNQSDIQTILFTGYVDEEEKAFLEVIGDESEDRD